MTKQIGQAYRRNKRGSLLLVAAVVALAVIAIWAVAGIFFAIRGFSWEARRS